MGEDVKRQAHLVVRNMGEVSQEHFHSIHRAGFTKLDVICHFR